MGKNNFFTVLLFIVLTACNSNSDKANRVMDRAEYYLETRPDSALFILQEELPDPESFTGRTQARFALLATQALHKNYIDFDSDSLIFLALSYYHDKKEIVPKGKSHLYYAHYLLELDLLEEAREHYEEAIMILEETDLPKYLGIAYEGVGLIDMKLLSDISAVNYFKKSLECFRQANDSILMCNAHMNLGLSYLSQDSIDNANYHYSEAQKIADLYNYTANGKLFYYWALYYRAIENYETSEAYYLKAIECDSQNETYHNSLANMYWRNNDFEKAKTYLMKSLKSDKYMYQTDAYYILSNIFKTQGNYKEALDALEISYGLDGEYYLKSSKVQEQLIQLSRKYLQARFDRINLKNENRMMILIITIIVILAVGAGIGIHFIDRYRNHKRRMREIEDEYNSNLKKIGKYRGLLAHYELQNNQLKKNNDKEINDLNGRIDLLTEQNKTLQLRLKNQGKILKMEQGAEIDKYISGLLVYYNMVKINPRYKIENRDELNLIDYLNFTMNNFVIRFKKETKIKMTNHEMQMVCLIKLGYSNEQIGKFFNSKSESVSRAKSRLKSRLQLPAEQSLDHFIRLF